MKLQSFTRHAGLAAAMVAASMLVVPMASARVHVGVGIYVPGISVGIGNCWSCGYVPPPVYYTPAYPAPVYYPAPAYYGPPPVYYGYGYYAPYPRRYYYRGYDRDRDYHHDRGGNYHHDHR